LVDVGVLQPIVKSSSEVSSDDGGQAMAAAAKQIEIGALDREAIVGAGTSQARMVERARIVFEAGEGRSAAQIGRRVGCSANTAQKWRGRFERQGLDGLGDLPRPGKPLVYDHAVRARLIGVPRFRGHLSAWVRRAQREGCGVHAKDASALSTGVPQRGGRADPLGPPFGA